MLGTDGTHTFGTNFSFRIAFKSHMQARLAALYAICRTFFSEKVVAFRRLVISSSRGCRQVPGLSVPEVSRAGAVLTGVVSDDIVLCIANRGDKGVLVTGITCNLWIDSPMAVNFVFSRK